MKLVVAPSIVSLLSLLVLAPACDDAKTPPGGDAKAGAEVEAGADARAAADAKAGADAKTGAEVKAGADAKNGSIAAVVADAKAVADTKADADAKAAAAAEATAASDAKAAATPGVTVTALYWAETNAASGRTEIDIIDSSDPEALMKLAAEHGDPDGLDAAFPATVKLPGGYAVGDEWVVATTTGEVRGKAVGHGVSGGASETHFLVALDERATGLAARARDWTGPIPTLRTARKLDMKKGPGKALFGRIEAAMVAAADPDAKKALASKPLAAKHVEAIEGRFPNGFTHLVTFTRPLAPAGDIGANHVAGMFLADATGRVEVLFPPALTINSDDFLYLVDLEGDGVDEVIYDDSYYEGSYRILMTWTPAGKAEPRTLTGDGA